MFIITQERCVLCNTHSPGNTESELPLASATICREFRALLSKKQMLGMRSNLGNKPAEYGSDIALVLSSSYGSEMFETFPMGQKDIYRDLKRFPNQRYTDSTKFDAAISFEKTINNGIMECQIYETIHTVVQLVVILMFTQRKHGNIRHGQFLAYTSLRHSLNSSKIHPVNVADGNYYKIMNSDTIDHKICCIYGGSMSVEKADSSCTEEGRAEAKERKSLRNDVESYPIHGEINEKNHSGRSRRKGNTKRQTLQKADSSCTEEDRADAKERKSLRNDVESYPIHGEINEKNHSGRRRRKGNTKRQTLQKVADSSCTEEDRADAKERKSLRNDVESYPIHGEINEKNHSGRRRRKGNTKRQTLQKVGLDESFRPRTMSKQRIKVPQIFIMIFILMRMEPGQAMPINRNLSPVWSAPLLTNLRCNNNTLKYSDTCQTDEGLLQLLLKQCDFKCDEGYTPKCVNTLDVVTAYICLQKDLSCKKGIRWIAQINTEKPSEVIIREEKCPNGTFQSSTSKCFDACSETHQDISLIGEMYSLYSYGDNANPTTVYCNYEKGFYSTEDKMFIDFDRESKFNPFLCRHVDDFNPCYGKMVPLPNGTCVLPCLNGGCRDVHDSFICKERCRQKPGEDVDGTMELSQDNEICNNILDTCKNGECNSKGDCECHKGFTYDEKMRQCKEEKRKEKSPYTVVVQSVSGGVLSVFLIIFFIWSNREKFRRKEDGPESCSLTSSAGTNLSRNEEDHQSLTSTSSGAGNYGEELKKNVDDTLTQSVLASLEKAMESCGALVYKGNMLGTAFRVGEKYLMTAFHVIRDIVEDSREPNHFLLYRIDDTAEAFVTFSESVCVQTHQFRFKVCYYNLANDVAILEITNCSDKLPDPLFLWQFENVWEKISTIGYGHPNNPYKKHLETCTVLRNDDVRFQTAHAYLQRHRLEFIDDIRKQGKKSESINRGYNGYNNEKIVVFDAYMEKGLSGGPILTNQANSIKVIGIVIARMPEFHDHLSDQMKYSFPKVYLFEVGVKMLYIYQSMRSEDPDLAAKLFP